MATPENARMKVLVAIASYGTKNDGYLAQLVREYRSMQFDVSIVVLTNVDKNLAEGAEVVVGLPTKNPWSLPFGHQQIFADRLDDYDIFIYSEDDTLITERNIQAFLRISDALPDNEIAGFLRFEQGPGGARNYPEIHGHFHWDTRTVRSRGEYELAVLTNEHSACYVATRQQLRRAIQSGGYIVEPHEGHYDLICTAATDIYTQCGFQRLICLSHLEDFLVHHLPNRYVGTRFGVDHHELHRQLDLLLALGRNGSSPASLIETETHLMGFRYSKNHYEPVRSEILSAIPRNARSILSIGCGWGATEAWLARQGFQVAAVPLDPIIAGGAMASGVRMVHGDFETARHKLAGERFDCLLIANILHLAQDPVQVLRSFSALLSTGSPAVVTVPNLCRLRRVWRALRHGEQLIKDNVYELTGMHFTSPRTLREWFRGAGLTVQEVVEIVPEHATAAGCFGLLNPLLADELLAVARRS
jgi:2-polyprenyl-3-methyl-5-hydroxy-6-metoxy-1,4-benzoquinol methylase